jgi:DNA-binding transcriptional ArsR family regulator
MMRVTFKRSNTQQMPRPRSPGRGFCCPPGDAIRGRLLFSAPGGRTRRLTASGSGVILKEVLNYATSLDLVFQALADPSRRGMMERLSRGPASVSELAEPYAMSLSAVVQHLQVLEASGLVRSQKVGRVRTCTIAPAALGTAEHWISERRTNWERRLDRLGEYLTEHPE